PLNKMTLEEKLQTMETLWDDLCKSADSLSSPDWHHAELLERESQVREGADEFVEWEKARRDIKTKLQWKSEYCNRLSKI
ncbi:hypothetical protein MNBD_GAMMA12-2214, partial [hydrothermal vent metagenome]